MRAHASLSVTLLQFADDTLLIGEKSSANVRALKRVMLLFEKISRLNVNFHKSLFGINMAGKLSGWKGQNHFLGSWMILLKFVLSAIPVYFLSFFKAPSVAETFALGWNSNGEAWEWCRRLFVCGVGVVVELKKIPLKINNFTWRLFLSRLATKMNLFRRNILDYNDSLCTATCGMVEDQDHLFFTCGFYIQLWLLISG
ncbi:transmembrane protein, putative [Medicago truncatula]|uniref:Transmembrane protein, putative n=1 Tax=Medicago truncatula TaxID=3880 RepID=A0A072TJM9_MEDTR|nr:transmembrane protein, putative [Medicago truncatula]